MKIAQTRKLHAAGILPTPAPTQDMQALSERLEALRLVFAAESLAKACTIEAVMKALISNTYFDNDSRT